MKTIKYFTVKSFVFSVLISSGLLSVKANAQVVNGSQQYQDLKQSGTIESYTVVPGEFTPQTQSNYVQRSGERSSACGCYTPPDASYTLSMAPNDDGSTGLIPIPFTFCLYGDTYTGIYINNNGNVSFISPFGTYSAAGFPSGTYRMVAPFWGDVDTRGIGEVWHKVTPTAVYINWVNVGYFNSMTDKTNTFQLILTNGNDPVIGIGNNVAFCYSDMQWTTGSASSGVNGFGGTPATVGANRGNGVDFVQFGRFDQPGTAYDGPFGNNDGVDWLDYKSIIFDACVAGSNIAPVPSLNYSVNGLAAGTGTGACDTLRLCVGDTLTIAGQFLSPENGQVTTIDVDTTGVTNVTINLNTAGNPANLDLVFIPTVANVGVNNIIINASDDGAPIMVTSIGLAIVVDTLNVPPPVIVGDTAFCAGGSVILQSGYNYDFYVWNTGQIDSVVTINAPGTYIVTGFLNGCSKPSLPFVVIEHPNPIPVISGNSMLCQGVTDTLSTDGFYVNYLWTGGGTDSMLVVTNTGTYMVTVTDTNGCVGSSNFAITLYTYNVGPDASICGNQYQVTGMNTAGGSWSVPAQYQIAVQFSPNNQSISPMVTSFAEGDIPLIFFDNMCQTQDTIMLSVLFEPQVSIADTSLCLNDPATLVPVVTGTNTYDIEWDNMATTPTITVTTAGDYEVTISNACGTVSAVATVVMYPCELVIPNIFTPNGDGTNDLFYIQNLEYWENNHLIILNRWGAAVHEESNYQNNWGGTNKAGKPLSHGTYFYILRATLQGVEHDFKGTVNISGQ